jgi:hypothetical protein
VPQIPVYQPELKTAVGSPVPVNSPTNTGDAIRAEAVQGFGSALFGLIKKIKDENELSAKELARYEAKNALTATKELLKPLEEAEINRVSLENDKADGTSAMERFSAGAKKEIEAVKKRLSPMARVFYEADASEYAYEQSTLVLAKEKDKREKLLSVAEAQQFNRYEAEVANDPKPGDKLLNTLGEMEKFILESSRYTDTEKVLKIEKQRELLVKGALQGLIANNRYGEAAALLTSDPSKSSSANLVQSIVGSEAAKILQEVKEKQYTYETQKHAQFMRNEAMTEARIKAERQQALDYFTDKRLKAGNNQAEINDIIAAASAHPRLRREDVEGIARATVFSEFGDDNFEAEIIRKSINGISKNVLIDDIEDAYSNGRLSADRRVKLLSGVRNLDEKVKKNPYISRLISKGEQMISSSKFKTVNGMTITPPEVSMAVINYNRRIGELSAGADGGLTAGNVIATVERYYRAATGEDIDIDAPTSEVPLYGERVGPRTLQEAEKKMAEIGLAIKTEAAEKGGNIESNRLRVLREQFLKAEAEYEKLRRKDSFKDLREDARKYFPKE